MLTVAPGIVIWFPSVSPCSFAVHFSFLTLLFLKHCATDSGVNCGVIRFLSTDGKCGPRSSMIKTLRHCPTTCESHFLGAKRMCYRLPKGLGCKCTQGFIREGHTCVRPRHCKCLRKCESAILWFQLLIILNLNSKLLTIVSLTVVSYLRFLCLRNENSHTSSQSAWISSGQGNANTGSCMVTARRTRLSWRATAGEPVAFAGRSAQTR